MKRNFEVELNELSNEDAIKGIANTLNCYNSRTLIEMIWVTILHYEDNVMPKEYGSGGV